MESDMAEVFSSEAEEPVKRSRGRQVQRVQFHTGVQIGTVVRISLDTGRDKMDMCLVEHGVFITTPTGDEYLVGMPGVLWMKLK